MQYFKLANELLADKQGLPALSQMKKFFTYCFRRQFFMTSLSVEHAHANEIVLPSAHFPNAKI